MFSPELALSARGLSKAYTIHHDTQRPTTAGEALVRRLKHPFYRPETETFYALRDLTFDLPQGEVLGIIGRNGAGKSTLLKILSRITDPTEGEVALYGRVGSLLEVGTGFHPELTGRENIFLNGAILGMSRQEIARQFDAIVDFSGIETFLDTPVKRYSSGMYVRLAFAVAAHLEPEILVVDEVLAVGDAEFQKKCLGKMKDVATSGRTVLFVSHHTQSVAMLCTSALYLDKGRMTYLGDVPGAIQRYTESFAREPLEASDPARRPGTGELRFTAVSSVKETFTCGEEKTVRFTVRRSKPFVGKYFISCHLLDERGMILAQCDSRMVGHWVTASDCYEGRFTLRTPWLKPGDYRLDMFLCSSGVMDRFEDACRLRVIPLLPYPAPGNDEATTRGSVFADFAYRDESTGEPDA